MATTIDLLESPEVELADVDVTVTDDETIEFSLQGTIQGVEGETLRAFTDTQLVPAEVTFAEVDNL